jgi:phosphatidate cytidylyltransferase
LKSDAPADMTPADKAPEDKPHGRAGRDLSAAIGVGVCLVVMILASLYFFKDSFVAIVVVAVGIGLWELTRAFGSAGIRLPFLPVATGGSLMLVSAYYGGMAEASVTMALTVIAILVWRLSDGPDGFVRDASAGLFTLSYLYLMASFVMLMLAESDGERRVFVFVIASIASDIGGYAAGVLLGKHPMAPNISPKKSWEGFGGSLLTGIAAGIGSVTLLLHGHWWVGVILGIAGVIMATLGDLAESLIKRDLGIKDMGDLLPGHGGLMDRLDSLIAVAPVAWLIMNYLVDAS